MKVRLYNYPQDYRKEHLAEYAGDLERYIIQLKDQNAELLNALKAIEDFSNIQIGIGDKLSKVGFRTINKYAQQAIKKVES